MNYSDCPDDAEKMKELAATKFSAEQIHIGSKMKSDTHFREATNQHAVYDGTKCGTNLIPYPNATSHSK